MLKWKMSQTASECVSDLKEMVPKNTLYENLAEESSELTQAALKMVRIGSSTNPTPVDEEKLKDNLIEELTDVLNTALRLLDLKPNELLGEMKLLRWRQRIRQAKSFEIRKSACNDDFCEI